MESGFGARAEVTVVYAREEPPDRWDAAVFLAGPTPRSADVASWRPDAVAALRERWRGPGRLAVFVPEHRHGVHDDYTGQVDWEERCLHLSDEVVFYVPRDLDTLPAFTTNVEWGMWHDSGRAVFGAPPDAPKNRYLLHYAAKSGVPTASDIGGTVAAALDRIGAGASRAGGEREVPLLLWRDASFQSWYAGQRSAGNALVGARVVFRFGMLWGLHVRMHVASEDRVKDNEVVIGRADVSAVVLHRPGRTLDETEVVLVREFRSPCVNGFVHELPGGSGPGTPSEVALAEVAEETGLLLDAARLREHGPRQVNATLSAHRAHLFSAEVTGAELAALRSSGPQGVAADGERTYVEVSAFGRIRRERLVDHAALGMIAEVLLDGDGAGGTIAAARDTDPVG
ncbi:nucleoside 2-deoxyribosyltransferase domain-containing protein [Actinomadura decatromicini]|uniref:nucleoside 2-deoxyribosyltransferase domain-containing protein n=1 Tax=Actinomadura decatromicini TaxID=2604572 RepID=UPI00165305EA|nr:nucleoside 2-deoxyribosyltransferase domain-containing protein [Actinomadura decatromicini]